MVPIVGLISPDKRRETLVQELGSHGINVAPLVFKMSDVDGVLVDASVLRTRDEREIVSRLPSEPDKFTALLMTGIEADSELDGYTLTPSVRSFAQQLNLHRRQVEVMLESRLRLSTLNALGSDAARKPKAQTTSKSLLYFGEPGPFYLKMKDEFERKGIRISAVLSERTAFESFRTSVPSAFIVTVSEAFCPLELLDHIHGRPDLKHMPVIAVSELEDRLPDTLDHITGLVRKGSSFAHAIRTIERLIDQSFAPTPVNAKDCAFPVRDKYTGAFSAEFAERHIKAQIELSLERNQPLCVARISPIDYESRMPLSADLLPKFGSLLDSVIRRQDFIARVDWNDFLVSMPATNLAQARETIERALRIIEMTSVADNRTFSFRSKIIPLKEFQSADQFWRHVSVAAEPKRQANQANVA